MQTKKLTGVLLLAFVAIANTASSVDLGGWAAPALQKLASINFYKQNLLYAQAILQEGIPALNVTPHDPYDIDAVFTVFQPYTPSYPNYTDMEILLNGLTVSDFSHFDINTAELDVAVMKANLSLYQEYVTFVNNDVRATAVDSAGRVLSCNCSHVEGGIYETTFDSVKQLEVVGTILHVKQFDLILVPNGVSITGPDRCTGDIELVDYMTDLLFETLSNVAFQLIPESLNEVAAAITEVLNDIFALRNITDQVNSMSADHLPQHQTHQLEHLLSEADNNIPNKIIRQSRTTLADYEDPTKELKKNPIKITWTRN